MYRADFAVVPLGWRSSEVLPLVVEVDGHDFHERTEEGAENAWKRDRWMTQNGATVFRFTGREVWRDPRACAIEVLDFASRS